MVAKSYQELEQISEVFTMNNRKYVTVRLRNGGTKNVRWYTDDEYDKMYPGERKLPGSQRLALGFGKGYITIFKGDTYDNKDWFPAHNCRYTRLWGWYLPSQFELPEALPTGVQAVTLPWDLVGSGENLLSDAQVESAIMPLIYDPSPSEYQGSIGERLIIDVSISRIVEVEGMYGMSKLFIMEDESGNVYVWNTSTKDSWQPGERKHLRGTVKDFRQFRNVKQTVLTRCQEVA